MTINDDWLIREVFDSQVEALDKILGLIKDSNLVEDSSFTEWTDPLYKLIYKYTND